MPVFNEIDCFLNALEAIRKANAHADIYISGLKRSKKLLEKVVSTRRAELIEKVSKAREGDFAWEGCRKIFKRYLMSDITSCQRLQKTFQKLQAKQTQKRTYAPPYKDRVKAMLQSKPEPQMESNP